MFGWMGGSCVVHIWSMLGLDLGGQHVVQALSFPDGYIQFDWGKEDPDRQPWDKLLLTELIDEHTPFIVKFHLRLGAVTWIAQAHYEEGRAMQTPFSTPR